MSRPFRQVDVFGAEPGLGNPVAVVLGADGLHDAAMRRFAAWTNLSETTFVLAPRDPAADYRVRIFTPEEELPFAGHPTLGTARAWLDAGGVPRDPGVIRQECGVGIVAVRRDGEALAFAAPPLRRGGPLDEETLADVCAVLGVDRRAVVAAAWADNGPGWIGVMLSGVDEVLAVRPDMAARPAPWYLGVVGAYDERDPAIEVRAFFPVGHGLREDPVTGSLNASVAQWLLAEGLVDAPYTARQGTALGRDGRVRISVADGEVWVGGAADVLVRGEADL
ncbi:PhzF family phenazine biosynthesis protein [Demequina pelophila]|uniref:PhzF family phenazine biosynthesis protein n=1 Tax=Demequina pelophila TaxID=1638984 RepID=UPI000784F12C|nr:PhzF family phenazine biosynthesis protein [Demequina pelophila]